MRNIARAATKRRSLIHVSHVEHEGLAALKGEAGANAAPSKSGIVALLKRGRASSRKLKTELQTTRMTGIFGDRFRLAQDAAWSTQRRHAGIASIHRERDRRMNIIYKL
jgi:hypothetical protein